jgi:transcriptional regulator with XRE-family HTH domain
MKAIKRRTYRTITGRSLDLGNLADAEQDFLATVHREYEGEPEWSTFASWWSHELREAGLSEKSAAYRICQDLEARLGIAEGKVAAPDYRDYLADLIEERYTSRYRFCKETGVDPGHLSRVLASRAELSLQNLQRVLEALHASLVIQPQEDLAERASPERAAKDLAGAAR